MSTNFGDRLSNLRKKKGLSQSDLASRLGFSAHTIVSRWEKNDAHPSFKHLLKLKDILDVDLHWLITGEIIDPQKRIKARFKETYFGLIKEHDEASSIVQQLETKQQGGQALSPEEEDQLRLNRGRVRIAVRMMENSLRTMATNNIF